MNSIKNFSQLQSVGQITTDLDPNSTRAWLTQGQIQLPRELIYVQTIGIKLVPTSDGQKRCDNVA
jgi:hypothetical protein